jgi:hypothetical protein
LGAPDAIAWQRTLAGSRGISAVDSVGQSDIERMRELAHGSTESLLTDEERAEYDSYLRIGNFLSIMQSRARRVLGRPIRDC